MKIENVTENQMNWVNKILLKHGDEYRNWREIYGQPHIETWSNKYGENTISSPEFEYYIITKFMVWKSDRVSN